jgi:hypothetical protein
MSENQLDDLEIGTFEGLQKLTDLRIMGNRLESLSSGAFNGLDSLLLLHLEDNELAYLKAGIFNRMQLSELHLSYNRLTCPSESIFGASDMAFDKMKTLQVLRLNHNRLTSSCPVGLFEALEHLSELNLDDNNVKCSDFNLPPFLKKQNDANGNHCSSEQTLESEDSLPTIRPALFAPLEATGYFVVFVALGYFVIKKRQWFSSCPHQETSAACSSCAQRGVSWLAGGGTKLVPTGRRRRDSLLAASASGRTREQESSSLLPVQVRITATKATIATVPHILFVALNFKSLLLAAKGRRETYSRWSCRVCASHEVQSP